MLTTLDEAIALGRGIERPFSCPVHDDTNPSASLNIVAGVWFCHSCGAGGKVTERNGSWALTNAKTAIKALFDEAVNLRPQHEGWLDQFDGDHPSPYWSQRVGNETAESFRCGTHPYTGLPTYPIRDRDGRPLGVVQRLGATPKYLYPQGISIANVLFGYERASLGDHVWLTEGAGDVMAISAVAATITALGVYGAGVHLPQIELIAALRPSAITIAFDNDAAGRRAAVATFAALRSAGLSDVAIHSWQSDAKDFADLGPNQRHKEVTHGRTEQPAHADYSAA